MTMMPILRNLRYLQVFIYIDRCLSDTLFSGLSECTVHLRVLGLPVGVLITPKDLKDA